jgi:hypothetical protein
MRRGTVVLLTLVVAVGMIGAAVTLRDADALIDDPISGNWSYADAQAFADYSLYDLGNEFEGKTRSSIERELDPEVADMPVRQNLVSTTYGDCDSSPSATDPEAQGCVPPLEVQMWPACERNPSVYDDDVEREAHFLRGVPVYVYDESEGSRLEVSTGAVTAIIFGNESAQLLRAVDALVPVNARAIEDMRPVGDRDPHWLAPPVPGALEGTLSCGPTPPTPPPPDDPCQREPYPDSRCRPDY